MTKVLVLILLVATNIACAAQKDDFGRAPMPSREDMEEARSVRIEKGRPNATDATFAEIRALKYLASTANDDGTWGEEDKQIQTTSMCLLAFLRQVGPSGSVRAHEHARLLKKTETWILTAKPETVDDRMALLLVLSQLSALTHENKYETRLNALMPEITEVDPLWQNMGRTMVFKDWRKAPQWALEKPEIPWEEQETKDNNTDPKTLKGFYESYLRACLAVFDTQLADKKERKDFDKWTVKWVVLSQSDDGSFGSKEDKIVATALAVLTRLYLNERMRLSYEPAWFQKEEHERKTREPSPESDGNDKPSVKVL